MTTEQSHYLNWQYDMRARHPEHNLFKDLMHQRSKWVYKNFESLRDIPCGNQPQARFDLIPGSPSSHNQPFLIFIHGGFWRSGDKSECAFIAEPLRRHGISTVLLNYSLASERSLNDIIHEIRNSFVEIIRQAKQLDLDPNSVVIGGHSAGGHLAAKIASTNWDNFGLPIPPIKASFGVSGIYDPRPLSHTKLQEVLAISPNDDLLVAKPCNLNQQGLQLVACGTEETQEIKRQAIQYVEHFKYQLPNQPLLWVKDCDHYSILLNCADENGELFKRILQLFL